LFLMYRTVTASVESPKIVRSNACTNDCYLFLAGCTLPWGQENASDEDIKQY